MLVPLPPSQHRKSWGQLNEAYHCAAANLAINPDVRIEQVNSQDRLTLTGLDKLDEPSEAHRLTWPVCPITSTDAKLEINIKST
jgi:hypothetical protein